MSTAQSQRCHAKVSRRENLSRKGFSGVLIISVGPSPCTPLRVTRFNDTLTRTTPRARSLHNTEKYNHTQKERKRRKEKPLGDVFRPAHHPWYRENEDKDNTTARLLRAPHKDHPPTSLPAASPSHGGGSGRGYDYAELKSQALRVASTAIFRGPVQLLSWIFSSSKK